MKTYTLKEFDRHSSRILKEAEEQEVELTRHGKGWLRISKVRTILEAESESPDFSEGVEPKVRTISENPIDNAALPQREQIAKLKMQIAVMEGGGQAAPVVVSERREVPGDLCEDHQTYWTTLKELQARFGVERGLQIWGRCRMREDWVVTPLNVVVREAEFGEVRAVPKPEKRKRGAA